MRINVSHNFWRNNCSPLIFGFVDSHVAKLHQRFPRQLKFERFYMLLNKNLKHASKSQTSPDVDINPDSETPVAVFVAPAWKIPFLLRGCTVVQQKSSNHRAFIWIVGLAVSLVSLSALRIVELFDWLSKIAFGNDSKVLGFDYTDGLPRVGLFSWPPAEIPSSKPSHASNGRIPVSVSKCDSPTDSLTADYSSVAHCYPAATDLQCSTAVNESSRENEPVLTPEVDLLASLFSSSPLHSLDASLNCPHFRYGINQLCVICWLNNPDQWVFGPALTSLDHSIFACLDKLANMASVTRPNKVIDLSIASSLLSRPPEAEAEIRSGLASSSTTAWRNVLVRNAQSPGSPAVGVTSQSLPPRKRLLSCDRIDCLHSTQSVPKMARSSGDGAPADAYTSSKSKIPIERIPSDTTSALPHNSPTGRPVFYTHDSDVELSPHQSAYHPRPTLTSPEQIRLTANRVLSKALELLGSKVSSSEPTHLNSVGQRGCINRTESVDSRRTGSHGSVHSLDSDGFEYDEVYSSNSHLIGYSFPMALDPDEEERIQQEEEAQLRHLLSTLTSLLNKKIDSVNCDGQDAAEDSNMDGKSHSGSTTGTQVNVPFHDLFQSASDITEDLYSLEEVLHKLHYKLQANQIELEQAEDNLDYAWHLHDNLDGSVSGSLSSGNSSSGSVVSLSSESASRGPSAVNPSISLPSPLVSEVPEETRTFTHFHKDSHRLCPLDLPVTDSLLTSFTSSYTNTSVEADSLLQSVTDSACGPSISTYSSMMITSVPDVQSVEARNLQPNEIQGSATLDRPRPRTLSHSKRSCNPRRRSIFHTSRSYKTSDHDSGSDWEEHADPDGFLHPEMTFDKDGTIDWSETNDLIR